MIGMLIVGWILTLFNLDNLVVTAINEIFNTNFTVAVYWLIVFIIGIIAWLKE